MPIVFLLRGKALGQRHFIAADPEVGLIDASGRYRRLPSSRLPMLPRHCFPEKDDQGERPLARGQTHREPVGLEHLRLADAETRPHAAQRPAH